MRSVAETGATDTVAEWRRAQLVAARFSPGLAELLALDTRYDFHALIELVERGCPAELAVRILAPLDTVPAA